MNVTSRWTVYRRRIESQNRVRRFWISKDCKRLHTQLGPCATQPPFFIHPCRRSSPHVSVFSMWECILAVKPTKEATGTVLFAAHRKICKRIWFHASRGNMSCVWSSRLVCIMVCGESVSALGGRYSYREWNRDTRVCRCILPLRKTTQTKHSHKTGRLCLSDCFHILSGPILEIAGLLVCCTQMDQVKNGLQSRLQYNKYILDLLQCYFT